MGGCVFGNCSSASSSGSSADIKNVRVVDLNGYVEAFDYPVPVSQVTRRPRHHFVFTAAQLLTAASLKPLTPETLLEPGRIYFLLPPSAFGNEYSPLDLAFLVKKLTAKAKSVSKPEAANYGRKALLRNPHSRGSSSPFWNSPAPAARRTSNRMADGVGEVCRRKRNNWRPILDTIREISFRKSHSDLQLVHL